MSAADRIETLVKEHAVVLFMKGTRGAPQCGFSATVVDILDDFLPDYHAVDVLSDPGLREGIKEYSEWPTIPQLYVAGKFVGGSDIVREMRASGELENMLGIGPRPFQTPEITLLEAAIEALREHWDEEGKPRVRLEIDRGFQTALFFDTPRDDDVVMDAEEVTLLLDRPSARRADGVQIDWVDTPRGAGFKIKNPNQPPHVRQLEAVELSRWLEGGKALELFDARTPDERARARIDPSTLLDARGQSRLDALDRDTVLVLYCHVGVRSQAAAEHCIRMGFREVHNLAGGIDAWSREVDPSVPRY